MIKMPSISSLSILLWLYIFVSFMLLSPVFAAESETTETKSETTADPVTVEASPQPATIDSKNGFLRISWKHPTKYENETPLPFDDLTGYNIFYQFNDQELDYLTWQKPDASLETQFYDYVPAEHGRYCFVMESISASAGKSKRTDPVCIDYDPAPNFPCSPQNVQVIRYPGLNP